MTKSKKKSTKGKVVKHSDQFQDINDKESWSEIPRTRDKGAGIYALYNEYGLYYVGTTTISLRSRLNRHRNDKHAGKWTKYSWFQVKRKSYASDIERIVLSIINPTGNKIGARVPKKKKK